MKLLVLSCDKYEYCWKPFFTLLEKYYPNHPECYLVCESKKSSYCKTINVKSDSWTNRFRKALEKIKDEQVLVMLDDFFIRGPVDEKRIEKIKFTDDIICYNFEQEYREPALRCREWDIQKDNEVYLNSCQPTIWNRKKLIERLQEDKTPQDWEWTRVKSPYIHFINNQGLIIDIGKTYDMNWGIVRGKMSKECMEFLKKEGLEIEYEKQD
jgi:hypothetical protein